MRVERQPAFVLHGRAYRETSLLLECLTRDHGRLGLVVRGARREKARIPRGALQPLTPLQVSYASHGELGTLTQAEAIAPGFDLKGQTLLCALYLNELVLRLTPRNDAQPRLFADYLQTLTRLAQGEALAWTLRRFERDLLAHLGYGMALAADVDGAPLRAEAFYAYRAEHGPAPWRGSGPRVRGAALLALGGDVQPAREDLPALRRLMRAQIAQHLGGGELRAWRMLDGAPRQAPGAMDEAQSRGG